MRVVSINLNKRMGNPVAKSEFLEWLGGINPDVLLVQEPSKQPSNEVLHIPGMSLLVSNTNLAIWLNSGSNGRVELNLPYVQKIVFQGVPLFNVYLDAYTCAKRAEQLQELKRLNNEPAFLMGDFNLAPLPEDGLVGTNISNFNSELDRGSFQELISSRAYSDAGHGKGFTIKRNRLNQEICFRCDLTLVDPVFILQTTFQYDHTVREGEHRFTDHSAQVLNFVEKSVASYKTAIPRKIASPFAHWVTDTLVTTQGIKSILDYGCGYGRDVEHYRKSGLVADGFDPHIPFGWGKLPDSKYDLVTLIFVLNVLPTMAERLKVLKQAAEYLNPAGKLLVVTRSLKAIESEVAKKHWQTHNDGYWSHPGKQTFQKGITPEEVSGLAGQLGLHSTPRTLQYKTDLQTTAVLLQTS